MGTMGTVRRAIAIAVATAATVVAVPSAPVGADTVPVGGERWNQGGCAVDQDTAGQRTSVCHGTFRDDADGDGRPDGADHTYVCAGIAGRGACAWTVEGENPTLGTVLGSVGVCAYAYNEASSASPRTPTQCLHDEHGCAVNGNIENPAGCDPD